MDLIYFSKIINKIYFVTVCSLVTFKIIVSSSILIFFLMRVYSVLLNFPHVFGDLTGNILSRGVIDNQLRFLSLPSSVKHFEQNIWKEILAYLHSTHLACTASLPF